MNDQVMKTLESASYELMKTREAKAKENMIRYEAAQELANRAYQNGARYIRVIFEQIISEYLDNPYTIEACSVSNHCSHNFTHYASAIDIPRPLKMNQNQDEKLAEFYNEYISRNNHINFLRRGKHSKNRNLPVKFDIEKIEQYNIFLEFQKMLGDIFYDKYNCFKLVVSIDALHDLTYEAYTDKLKADGYLLDDRIIRLLKNAYIKTEEIKEKMRAVFSEAKNNTELIYNDVYNKLAGKYIENPGCGLYNISIMKESGNAEHQKMISFFSKSSLIDSDDELLYLEHMTDEEKCEYIPVLRKALASKFDNYFDKEAGYDSINNSNYGPSSLVFVFLGNKFGKFMDELEKNIVKKRTKRR